MKTSYFPAFQRLLDGTSARFWHLFMPRNRCFSDVRGPLGEISQDLSARGDGISGGQNMKSSTSQPGTQTPEEGDWPNAF